MSQSFRDVSALRDMKHTPRPSRVQWHEHIGIVGVFTAGMLVAVSMAILYGHLSASDDAIVPIAPPKCEPARQGETLHEVEADGRLACFYVRRVAGIRAQVRKEVGR